MTPVSSGFPWFIVSVFVVGFLPGLLLVIAGRRGKRIDDHPICRGCGFDLIGTIEPDPEKYPKCPECGTRREPRIGNRKRRGPLVMAGVMLMLASLGGAGVWGYGQFGAAQLAQYKPIWLLRWEARSMPSSLSQTEAALSEMANRLKQGKLSANTADQLVQDAVNFGPARNPGVRAGARGSMWDNFAATLLKAGHGTPAQREAIGRSWIKTQVNVRPTVRVGQPVPIRIAQHEFGPDYNLGLYEYLDKPSVVAEGQRYNLGIASGGGLSGSRGGGSTSSGWTGTSLSSSYGLPPGLGLGVHEFEIEVPIRITDGQHGAVLAQWVETHPIRFEYVPEDGDPITMIRDPALGKRVEQAVTLREGELEIHTYGINSMLDWSWVPTNLAYQIYVQRGDQKWKISTLAAKKKWGGHGWGLGGKVPDEWPDGTLVDLVFEPSPDAARDTPDMTAILDHPFVIKDVKIVRPGNNP